MVARRESYLISCVAVRVLVALFAVAVVAATAHADSELAEAHRLEAALDYEGALAVVDKAISHGGADPQRLAELHLLAGTLAADLDRTDVATDHFARLLALHPGQRLPEGTSPKITTPFDAAKAKNVPALHVTPTYIHGVVTIVPDADPLRLVRGLQVRIIDALGRADDVTGATALRVELPPNTRATEASALDEYGNRVWVGPLSEPVPVVVSTPWYSNWKTYAIAGTVAAAFGVFAASRMSSDQDAWDALRQDDGQHDFSELDKLRINGDKWATTANISFAIGGALGVVAVVQLIRHLPRKGEDARVTITPGPGAIGVGLAGAF